MSIEQHKVTYFVPIIDERGKPSTARVEVFAPLHTSPAQLDAWVEDYLKQHPDASLASKSWRKV